MVTHKPISLSSSGGPRATLLVVAVVLWSVFLLAWRLSVELTAQPNPLSFPDDALVSRLREQGSGMSTSGGPDASGGHRASRKEVRDESLPLPLPSPSPPVKTKDPDENGERLFVTDANTPGVPDLYGYVEKYWATMVKDHMVATLEEASSRQVRTTVRDLGMDGAVHLSQTATSLVSRVRFLEGLYELMAFKRAVKMVGVVVTIDNDVVGVERRVLPWMQYHVELGVARFYFFYDGSDPAVMEVLNGLPFSVAFAVNGVGGPDGDGDGDGDDSGLMARYRSHQTRAAVFSSSVEGVEKSNEVLMTKQTFGMEEGARRAAADGVAWLLHIDTDELFLPEGHDSIPRVFEAAEADGEPTVRFLNLEAQVEAGDVTSPFLQTSLFRNHQYFTTKDAQHYRSTFKQGLQGGFLTLYANGKSAARLDDETMPSAHGPHYWKPSDATAPDVADRWHNRISNSSYILHYSYTNPHELIDKARRSCPQHWPGGGSGSGGSGSTFSTSTFSELKRDCFVLDVDARAFQASAKGLEAATSFFYENFVYSEGAPTSCSDWAPRNRRTGWCSMTDIGTLKELMVRMQLMRRFTLPQVILQRHEEEIRRLSISMI